MEDESLIAAPAEGEVTNDETVVAEDTLGTPDGESGWTYADGVGGEGERPEWFKDKYKSVSDQAQAYSELEKKFGGFTGAPEDAYELSMPEGIEGEFDMEDPRIEWFQKAAKDSNMSQDTFSQMLHGWVQQEVGGMQSSREAEIQELGSNAQARLKDLGDWGSANLSPDDFEGFKGLASTAAGVKTLEALIAKTNKGGVVNTAAMTNKGVSEESLKERIADPKYRSSAAYRKETEKMFNDFYSG
jgi:hypothetical protein